MELCVTNHQIFIGTPDKTGETWLVAKPRFWFTLAADWLLPDDRLRLVLGGEIVVAVGTDGQHGVGNAVKQDRIHSHGYRVPAHDVLGRDVANPSP